MNEIVISGTGVFTPKEKITNKELVEAYNSYAENFNLKNKDGIYKGDMKALEMSSEEFIYNASGIKNRYVMNKKGILDPNIMHPILEKRNNDEPSIMAEISIFAAKKALENALNRNPILVTALNPVIGYAKAAEIAKKAYRENLPIIEVALEETNLTRAQLSKYLDPKKLIRGGIK